MTPLSLRISARLALSLAKAEFSSSTLVMTTWSVNTVSVAFALVFCFNIFFTFACDFWFNYYEFAFAGLQGLQHFFWKLYYAFAVVACFFDGFESAYDCFAL